MDFINKKHILGYVRRAVSEFAMIEDGDRIAIGVSGGKDSLTLLCALSELKKFYNKKFEIIAISLDMSFGEIGLEDIDYFKIKKLCENLGVELKIIKTQLAKVIFQDRQEKSSCSLCAKMRRGILNEAAAGLNCNKVALGHHFDDLIETFMLNLIHEGRLAAFYPVTYLSRINIKVIRPLVLAPEKEIKNFALKNSLPVAASSCPANGNTQREAVKQMLRGLDREYKGLKHRIYGAIFKAGLLDQNNQETGGEIN